MSQHDDITRLQLRVTALEFFVAKLYAGHAIEHGVTLEEFKQLAAAQLDAANEQVFPELHPAQSDHTAAEWLELTRHMLTIQTEILADMWAKKSG